MKKTNKLCLLIVAHNEELFIKNTIESAEFAGLKKTNIFLVDDGSTDKTHQIAKSNIDKSNVVKIKRSGKGLAISKAVKKLNLISRYEWIHIADADGVFGPDYFKLFMAELDNNYVAATGYVKSLPGGIISQYRVFEYTIGMELHRRIQTMFKTIPVIPGPTSCFKSSVFNKLSFSGQTLTEDFDVTLQIYRANLGNIQFIKNAQTYTQDPRFFREYLNQITRWNRGIFQGILKHKIGKRFKRIDAYLSFQVFQNFLFFINYCLIIPIFFILTKDLNIIAGAFLFDVVLTLILTILVAVKSSRYDILNAFPFIYILRWISLLVFMKSYIEVIIFRRFKPIEITWNTSAKRYKVRPILLPPI